MVSVSQSLEWAAFPGLGPRTWNLGPGAFRGVPALSPRTPRIPRAFHIGPSAFPATPASGALLPGIFIHF